MSQNPSHCRISRVRMKNGPDVRVLARDEISPLGNAMREGVHTIAGTLGHEMDGYFIIGWDRKGNFSNGFHHPADGAIPLSLLPAWIAEIVRRQTVTTVQINDVLETR